MLIFKAFGRVQRLRNLTLSIQISINISSFFCHPSLDFIFRHLQRLGAKIIDLGVLLAPSWVQNCSKNQPSGDKKHVNFVSGAHSWASLLPSCFSGRSWAPFWWIWDDFGMDFDGFWHHCSWILVASLQRRLQNAKAAWHETKWRNTSRTCR